MAVGAVFRSHFNASVNDWIVWGCILVSGSALVAFFAFLHRPDGILCTAPICPAAITVDEADARFGSSLGERPLDYTQLPDAPTPDVASDEDDPSEPVQIDRGLGSTLYFSIVTFTTLGYGDFQPVPRMRLIASIQAILGYAFLGLLVGLLIDLGSKRKSALWGAQLDRIEARANRRLRRKPKARSRRFRQRSRPR
ncbi:MAG: potassium channel family protein [Paracoccaceae bacterium]|nr:potassium channel family protein [Paracoccaceae bacterium]